MKSNVFKLANALRKTGLSLSEAVRRAWATIKLKANMMVRPTLFWYIKEDKTVRVARGYYGAAPQTDKPKTENPAAIATRYFDLKANAWRSFRADRLILA